MMQFENNNPHPRAIPKCGIWIITVALLSVDTKMWHLDFTVCYKTGRNKRGGDI